MKQPQDFISASEASVVTGLSVSTLGTFAEAGYLHVEIDSDGLHMFSRGELTALFGAGSSEPAPTPPETKTQESTLQTTTANLMKEPISFTRTAIELPQESDENIESAAAEDEVSEVPLSVHTEEASPIAVKEHTRSVGGLRREITKLRTVVELQERIIGIKDRQIKDLKEQREWLHTRIERSDEKHHRDQILLLSETQTIRELIKTQQTKSPLRSMLEFFRIVPPEPTQAQLAAPKMSETPRGTSSSIN